MIDFNEIKPQVAKASDTGSQTQDDDLFEFEVIPLIERRFEASPRRVSRLNDIMAFIIAGFLMLVPVPFGANRPLAWIGAVFVISLLVAGYFGLVGLMDPERKLQIRRYRLVLVTGFGAIAFAALQLLPLTPVSLSDMPAELLSKRITVSSDATVLAIARMISYALLFILVIEVCTNRIRTELLLRLIFFGFVAHAIWALVSLGALGDTILFQEKDSYAGYATGTFINRNSFATFMGFGAVLGTSLALVDMRSLAHRSPNRRSKLKGINAENGLILVMVCIILAALLASGSRLGTAATIIGIWLTAVVILLRTGVPLLRVILLSLLAGTVGSGLFLVAFGIEVLERAIFSSVDSVARLTLYSQTWQMIIERPLMGFGLDGFQTAFEIFHKPELNTSNVWDKPHNTYLTLWSELGVIAGSLPVLATAFAGWMALRAIADKERGICAPAAALGVIAIGAIHSLGDFSLEIAANTYMFVAIVSLGIARSKKANGPI